MTWQLTDGGGRVAMEVNADGSVQSMLVEELPPGVVPAPAPLAARQAAAWEAIKARRDHLSDAGGYTTAGKWFHSDPKSKTQQLGLAMMGATVPAVEWTTMDGTTITMTPALASDIFQAAAAQDMALYAAAKQHQANMLAAADPLAYDFSGGWPATFPG